MEYERQMKQHHVRYLPHGRAIVEESNSKIVVYRGHLEPTSNGWLHIHDDSGKGYTVPSHRVIKIEWDERWKGGN